MKDSLPTRLRIKYFAAIITNFCLWNAPAFSQITPERLQQYTAEIKNLAYAPEAVDFYTRLNYQTAWIQNENAVNRNTFFNTLKLSAGLGLQESDYQYDYIQSFRNGSCRLQNTMDSMEAEVRITDAAIHFYHDMYYGNTVPVLGFNGLKNMQTCRNIPALLAEYATNKLLPLLSLYLTPPLPEVTALEIKIKWYHQVMADNNFREVTVSSAKATANNNPLIIKLYQLGIIDSAAHTWPDSILKQKIKEAQAQFCIPADGILHSNILKELSIPISVRLQQLSRSINYYRWLHCLTENQSVINVNIPAAELKVYRDHKIILDMRVIVGKKSTPTPTLASTVDEVILYPYWHVPFSIATKELLPAIKRNPGYINAGNYQVLNSAGKIMNPYSVKWHAFSTHYFPYIIRQSTGCDNALGLIKLNFYNPFGVYLHDTPNKSLFKQSRRFFSHGCMRMEKPLELGHLILKYNAVAIDTLEQMGCLHNQSPVYVSADEHMPVIVWYNPAGIDAAGRVHYYQDIYGKFNWLNN